MSSRDQRKIGVNMWDQQFEQLLRRHLPFLSAGERLGENVNLRDFGLDSFGIVQLLDSLENTYGVQFVDEVLRMETFETPGVLWGTLSTILEPIV